MHVIYPFIHSACDDLELLLSICTLERFKLSIDAVTVVGDLPRSWDRIVKRCDGRHALSHVEMPKTPKSSPICDVRSKLHVITGMLSAYTMCMLMHDDTLVLNDVEVFFHEYEGTLQRKAETSGRYWGQIARRTAELLPGDMRRNYDCHTPILFNARAMHELLGAHNTDVLVKSLYLNTYPPMNARPGKNRKMRAADQLTAGLLYEKAKVSDYLSLNDSVTAEQIELLLRKYA